MIKTALAAATALLVALALSLWLEAVVGVASGQLLSVTTPATVAVRPQMTQELVASSGDLLSAEEATRAALRHIALESTAIPAWKNAAVSPPTTHYDLRGAITAYVFSVLNEGNDVGYVTISARRIPNVVLEFSTRETRHKKGVQTVGRILTQQGDTKEEVIPLYLGPPSYFVRRAGRLARPEDLLFYSRLRGHSPAVVEWETTMLSKL